MATVLLSVVRRRQMASLLVVLVVVVTALLVNADVETVGGDYEPTTQATQSAGWSYYGTLAKRQGPFAGRTPESQAAPELRSRPPEDNGPAAVRSALTTPTALPVPTPDGTSRRLVVPILMYHHIGEAGPGADAIREDLSVSPADFEAQLRYLIERGYEPTSLESLVLHLQTGRPLPEKPVVLTFDDGFSDQYTNAYPLLYRYGFTGTFFIITRFPDEGRPEYMAWSEIELLHAGGMEIGSHSYTHPSLKGKSFEYIVWQVLGSKEAIEARIREPVRFFSYPSGQYDQLVKDVLQSAGYWAAVTVESGSLQSSEAPFELRRIRVRGSYDLGDFDYWFNYWLSHP
jgi:peptidoglycan/xylan/chitin deacetylase (PgdA/CDA1 family)